ATNNLVRSPDQNNQAARFYKVVKLDTDPPEVWRLAPASNAIAVGLQSPLKAYLRDETAIDSISIALTVGTNPPVTLADPRMNYTNSGLSSAYREDMVVSPSTKDYVLGFRTVLPPV